MLTPDLSRQGADLFLIVTLYHNPPQNASRISFFAQNTKFFTNNKAVDRAVLTIV